MPAVAGAMSLNAPTPGSAGTCPKHTPLFVVLLKLNRAPIGKEQAKRSVVVTPCAIE